MRKVRVTALFLAFCAVSFASGQGEQRPEEPSGAESKSAHLEIPEFIPHPGNPSEWIIWARGSYFEDQFGGVDKARVERYLTPYHYLILKPLHEEALATFNNGTEPPDCLDRPGYPGQGHHDPTFPEPPSSVAQMVDRAAIVATGTVTDIATGIVGLNGGSMLLVRLDGFASRDGYERSEQMLVFWPFGEIRIGHATLCASSNDFPPAPSVGDKIMLFPQYELYDADSPFLHVDRHASGGAAVYANAGGLVIPGPLARAVPRVAMAGSFAALNGAVQAAVKRSVLR